MAPPTLVANDINAKNGVHFRSNTGILNCAGGMFAKEQYLVVRSPNANWNGSGSFLGRKSDDFLAVRSSSYNMSGGTTGFWQDHYPSAVSKNGTAVVLNANSPSNGCGYAGITPITNYMVLKITVDNQASAANLIQYPYYQIGKNETLGTMDFDVAEIIGYNTTLSAADEAKVGSYLAQKYLIASSYPIYYLALSMTSPTVNQEIPYGTSVAVSANATEPNTSATDTVKFYTKLLPSGSLVETSATDSGGGLFTAGGAF